MTKKSFKTINPAMSFITSQGETQEAPEVQEAQDTQEAPGEQLVQGTQGKKGHKLPRINMAFTRENLDYLQLIARIEGVSITEYVNRLVRIDQAAQADTVAKAKEVLRGTS